MLLENGGSLQEIGGKVQNHDDDKHDINVTMQRNHLSSSESGSGSGSGSGSESESGSGSENVEKYHGDMCDTDGTVHQRDSVQQNLHRHRDICDKDGTVGEGSSSHHDGVNTSSKTGYIESCAHIRSIDDVESDLQDMDGLSIVAGSTGQNIVPHMDTDNGDGEGQSDVHASETCIHTALVPHKGTDNGDREASATCIHTAQGGSVDDKLVNVQICVTDSGTQDQGLDGDNALRISAVFGNENHDGPTVLRSEVCRNDSAPTISEMCGDEDQALAVAAASSGQTHMNTLQGTLFQLGGTCKTMGQLGDACKTMGQLGDTLNDEVFISSVPLHWSEVKLSILTQMISGHANFTHPRTVNYADADYCGQRHDDIGSPQATGVAQSSGTAGVDEHDDIGNGCSGPGGVKDNHNQVEGSKCQRGDVLDGDLMQFLCKEAGDLTIEEVLTMFKV